MCAYGSARFVRLESVVPPLAEVEDMFPERCWGRIMGGEAFQRMLRSEAQVENLTHRWPGIIFSQRPDFSFAFISPNVEELTGVPAEEWRRQTRYFWDAVHESDAEALRARLRSEDSNPGGTTSTYRIRHIKTGRVRHLWEHRQALRSSNGLLLGYEGVWLDITRQAIAERRLLSLSWRDSLGTLTMGLAHDFCNIMTGIVGLSETAELSPGLDNSVRTSLGFIRSTAMQAGQLAHRIRQLHEGTPGEKRYVDLNQAIGSLVELLPRVLPRRVRVQAEVGPGQLALFVDAVELQQVMINLALNASDAMTEPGQLLIRAARHDQPPSVCNLQGVMPRSPLISLSVQDTGGGIPERYLGSIFDPFFTTKPLGKGSGLGLYNARLFAEKSGDAISVEPEEGVGTTFHLWFPEADFTETQKLLPAAQKPSRQTLLAVGVSGELLEAAVQMLRCHGYYVQEAITSAEALDCLHAPDSQFAGLLVLGSSVSPEELSICERVRAKNLPLKILLCLVGCDRDEIPDRLFRAVDAVVPFDVPAQDFLTQLKTALNDE